MLKKTFKEKQMTKVAIWCRHEADNLIGIGDDIPWHIPSDSRFFADVIAGQDVVFGRKTYETVPPEVLSDCAVWVLSKNQNYEPRNPDTERLVGDVRAFKEFEGDLYIGGGAAVYLQFMDGAPKLQPDIIVDCVYGGAVDDSLPGEKITVTPCVEIMKKKYFKISNYYEKDGVRAALWVKKGDFVEQSVLKRLLLLLESR